MKLVVGLGNIGKEYENTRHNIGFMVVDNYLDEDTIWKDNVHTFYTVKKVFNEDVIFIKPKTYMNLSGIAVREVVNYYKIDIDDILVIQDDLDLEVGVSRLKRNSSSGGHNGIKSIIGELNTDSFARLKIGIGKDDKIPTDKYVLSRIPKEDLEIINNNMDKYKEIIDIFIKSGYVEVKNSIIKV